jgi:hypothetical protein
LTPGGAISLTSVACSPPRRAVTVMPPSAMFTDSASRPIPRAIMLIQSRTRNAVSPARSINVPKRIKVSSAMVRSAGRSPSCATSDIAPSLSYPAAPEADAPIS